MRSRLVIVLLISLAVPAAATPNAELPTTDIKVDQVGYLTGFHKLAFLAQRSANASTSFEVRRADTNKAVIHGRWSAPVFNADSGDQIQTADFSSLDIPGTYYLYAAGVGKSWTFRIGPDVYRHAYYLTARGFYGQRCGTAVTLGSEFPGYSHPICHQVGQYDPSSGKEGPHVSTRGWHDAGDYGRYIVNSGISTATLLWAVELFGSGPMKQVSLNLPESGNGTPDLLNEVRWNMEWMLTLQDTDGGVWHKQTSAHFCGFVPPEKDTLPSLVIGSGSAPFKTTCATADLAAVAAIAARIFAPYDRAFAGRCLGAARKAWDWVIAHPPALFHNPSGITTGEYGDSDCSDEQLWAAAELERTTREPVFESYFAGHYREFLDSIAADNPPSFANMGEFALWTYALGNGPNQNAIAEIENRSLAAADAISARTEAEGYRSSLVRKNYIWGSNGVVANYALQLLVANRLRSNHKYLEAAASNLHYLLGSNTFSLCFVTQLGSHAVQHIHHRPSANPNLKQPWPGLLSGGPNIGREDPEMKRLVSPESPPARAFLDVQGSYASNEIAINWNAPLVFVLAGLLSE